MFALKNARESSSSELWHSTWLYSSACWIPEKKETPDRPTWVAFVPISVCLSHKEPAKLPCQKTIKSSDHPGKALTGCTGLKGAFPRAVLQAALSRVSPTQAKLKPQAHSAVYFCEEPTILGVLGEQTHLAERCHFASPFWPSACASNHSFRSLCRWEQCLGTMSFWRETPLLALIAARPLHPPKIIKQWDSRHSILRSEMTGKEWEN